MEVRSFPSITKPKAASKLAIGAAVLALGCGTVTLWDSRTLRETPDSARDRLRDGSAPERWQAVTVLLRDARQTIAALQDAARGSGAEAEEARRAIAQLHDLTR